MRKLFYLFLFLTFVGYAQHNSVVNQQGNLNSSTITQDNLPNGGGNLSNLEQSGDNNSAVVNQLSERVKFLFWTVSAIGHESKIQQVGTGNSAEVDQDVADNYTWIVSNGINHKAFSKQYGLFNETEIRQTNENNLGDVDVYGKANKTVIHQFSENLGSFHATNNSAIQKIGEAGKYSYMNNLKIDQTGDANEATQNVIGTELSILSVLNGGNKLLAKQTGNENIAEQEVLGGANDLHIEQYKIGNYAIQTVNGFLNENFIHQEKNDNEGIQETSGLDNYASLIQNGNGNYSIQVQNGMGNFAQVEQNLNGNNSDVNQLGNNNTSIVNQN